HIPKCDSALAPWEVERMGLRLPTLDECGQKRCIKTEVSQLYRVLKPCLPDKSDQRLRWDIKKDFFLFSIFIPLSTSIFITLHTKLPVTPQNIAVVVSTHSAVASSCSFVAPARVSSLLPLLTSLSQYIVASNHQNRRGGYDIK
ncbi:hypothetical protein PIB30_041468, partial [Stylosanthes scabra]|nr:hypothetical protein [Stylosanthes scabra]